MDNTELLLKNLMETNGISGYEDDVTKLMADELIKYKCLIEYDNLGSVIGIKKGDSDSPKIMISGHVDEIGFLVKQITDDGFLKVIPIGYWNPHNLLGQRFKVKTKKQDIIGTMVAKIEDKDKIVKLEDMYLDIGAQVGFDVKAELGVAIGDPVTPYANFEIMGNKNLYIAKAWDDRLGVALAIKTVEKLSSQKHPNTLFAVGTVQEEVGLRGARTAAQNIKPDVAFCS